MQFTLNELTTKRIRSPDIACARIYSTKCVMIPMKNAYKILMRYIG